ncbi:hypothetical protein ACWDSJ_11150 [Nocardia sp. NPDC003482]
MVGIEYKPEDDPKKVRISRGLPEGVSRAEVTFRVEGGLRGSRVVRRSEAEFAFVRTATDGAYEGVWSEPERVWVGDADRYIERARRRILEQEAEIRRRREAVDLSCPWCARERDYIGVLGFITGVAGFLTEHPAEWGQEIVKQHAYRCGGCGSMQFFADGFLEHPLPGRPHDA